MFGLDLRPGMRALDLGAAPGGWTFLLAERGLDVVAVDPAALAPQVEEHARVTHLRLRAQEAELDSAFDLVPNDMVMDPADSALAMLDIAAALRRGGHAVMTLKLPYRQPWPSIRRAREVLERG